MPVRLARASSRGPRLSIYKEVTGQIVRELEQGRLPWVQPWGTKGVVDVGLPRNALTGRSYSGINVLILWAETIERSYYSQGWLTFRQVQAAGGIVRKGERGTSVVYADRFVPRGSQPVACIESGDEDRSIPFLKRFTLFNVAQCDGLAGTALAEAEPLPDREIVPIADAVIASSRVDFRIGGDRAFYCLSGDFVQVPPQPTFFDQVNYYRTCLHELAHATGHTSRLGRSQQGQFGTKAYAREELVAEIGSAFLCAALGIQPTVRHADYVGSWLEVLRDDERAIFRAASGASRAADWLLDRYEEDLEQRTRLARLVHQVGDDGA